MERVIARLATGQHGIVSRGQLLAAGLTHKQIDARLARGQLHDTHRGVYAAGHAALTLRGNWIAAVLACGLGATLSHRSAAALHGLLRARGPSTHVTTWSTQRRRTPTITTHRTRILPAERTVVDGIPVTTVARTLFDLADGEDERSLGRAFEEADRLGLLAQRELADLSVRGNGRRGLGKYRRVLAAHRVPPDVRSEMERIFLEVCDRERIPRPETNVWVGTHLADGLWPAAKVVVELDSWGFHRTQATHERDHEETVELELAGYEVVRFSYRQLTRDAGRVAARVRRALTTRAT